MHDIQGLQINSAMEAVLKSQRSVMGSKFNQESQKVRFMSLLCLQI